MAQEVKINLATVGAQQATQQTKTLKEQIKDLRNELGQLTAGTEEYNQKVQELGNLMHQNQEITEQAKIATQDYGQTLNNLNTIAGGVVGSFTAIQGVMNLLGSENEDATKTIKTMTSLMGILQGLSALESFEKTMGRMWTNVKKLTTATNEENVSMKVNTVEAGKNAGAMAGAAAATKAEGVAAKSTANGVNLLSFGFKKLGTAIKSFMASNPFTLILLGLTAAITAISSFIEKEKEAAREAAKMNGELMKTKGAVAVETASQGPEYQNSTYYGIGKKRAVENYTGKAVDPNMDSRVQQLEQLRKQLKKAEEEDRKYTKETQKLYKQFYELQETMAREHYNYLLKKQAEYRDLAKKEKDKEIKQQYEETAKSMGEQAHQLMTEAGRNYVALADYQIEAATQANSKLKERLDNQYQIDKINLKNHYEQQEITTEEYYTRLKEIETKHLEDYKKYAAALKLTKKDIELLQANHNSTMIALNKDLARELDKIWKEENDPEKEHTARKLQEQTRAAEEAVRRRKQDETIEFGDDDFYERQFELANSWIVKRIALLDEYNNLEVEREYQKNQKLLELSIERQRMDLDELEYKKNMEINDDSDNTEFKIQEYQRQYEEQIISLDEFQRKEEELRLQHQQKVQEINNEYIQARADAEYQLSETIYQLHEQEYEHEVDMFQRKIQLTKNYLNAFSTLTSGVQGLLNEAQNGMKEGSKEYEQIQEAKIIMDTITGSLSAFMSGVESGIPAPYNFILAGVLAATATATGIMALQNLKSKKLSSGASSASINVNPYETIATETNSNIEDNIQDQRVVVVESDITDTVNRVRVAENEASF